MFSTVGAGGAGGYRDGIVILPLNATVDVMYEGRLIVQ